MTKFAAWTARLYAFLLAYREPLSIGLGVRLGLGVLAVVAGLYLPPSPQAHGSAPYVPPAQPFLWDRLLWVWANWDGLWYVQIATAGYQVDDGTPAFSPLYPGLVGVGGALLGGRPVWAGVILSALCTLAALVLLYDLVRRDYPRLLSHDPDLAGRTVLFLAVFPMAFFLWAVYSESLFLLLAVAMFWAVRRGRPWLAALCLGAALLTRPFGVVLVLPLLWEFWLLSRPQPPGDVPRPALRPRDWLAWLVPGAAVVGLLGWAAMALGDPLAFVTTQAEWNRSFRWPWETVLWAWREAAATPLSYQVELQSATYLVTLLVFAGLALAGTRVLRGPHSLYVALGVLFPLFSGTPHNPLLSFPRFMLVLFPAFLVLAVAGRWRPAYYAILCLSTLLLALYCSRFVNWFWVA